MAPRPHCPLTGDLFDWQPPQVAVGYSADVAGRGRLDNKIARLIGQALRDGCTPTNPRVPDAHALTELYRRAWTGGAVQGH